MYFLMTILSPARARFVGSCLTVLILFLFSICLGQDRAQLDRALATISPERMLADVRKLSLEFNGRQTGTEDDLRSAKWVADQFLAARLGLASVPVSASEGGAIVPGTTSLPTDGFLSIPSKATFLPPTPVLQVSTAHGLRNQQLGTDFLPVLDSPSADIRAPIVFVGYGIIDPSVGMNEYDGIDVNNCVVLFLRGKPNHYKGTISHADKVRIAYQKGAVAYLTATGPVLSAYEMRRGLTGQPSAFYGLTSASEALPGAWISTTLAEQILAGTDPIKPGRLRTVQEELNQAPGSRSSRTSCFGILTWETRQLDGFLVNVVATLPGTDPKMAQEAVVIGAHRDHFGRQGGLLFPGADDNASGTAVILEVARAINSAGLRPKRTILFVSFSGEEQGLLGSRLYLERAPIPLSSTKAMINVDHAGIGNGRLTVGLSGLDKQVALAVGQEADLADRLDIFGFFPGGDHVPFKEAGVPTVTVVSSGAHPHFHQPSDTADTVRPDILRATARYVLAFAWHLGNAE
jgi:hypothetical protein